MVAVYDSLLESDFVYDRMLAGPDVPARLILQDGKILDEAIKSEWTTEGFCT